MPHATFLGGGGWRFVVIVVVIVNDDENAAADPIGEVEAHHPPSATSVCRLVLGRNSILHRNSILRKLSTFYLLFSSPQHRQICRRTAPTRDIFRAI